VFSRRFRRGAPILEYRPIVAAAPGRRIGDQRRHRPPRCMCGPEECVTALVGEREAVWVTNDRHHIMDPRRRGAPPRKARAGIRRDRHQSSRSYQLQSSRVGLGVDADAISRCATNSSPIAMACCAPLVIMTASSATEAPRARRRLAIKARRDTEPGPRRLFNAKPWPRGQHSISLSAAASPAPVVRNHQFRSRGDRSVHPIRRESACFRIARN
jgi:hypothetical protein